MTHLYSRQNVARVLPLIIFVLPMLLLAFGAKTEYGASRQDREVNLSGSLRFRSLWIYGAVQSHRGEDWHTMLARMQAIRTNLRTRYPNSVSETDAAWARFSGALQQTGQVGWVATNRMQEAANTLTEAIESKARHEHQTTFWLLLSGVVTTGALGILLSRSIRHDTRREHVRQSADERFRVLFEYSSDAHLLFDDTGIIDCNNAAVKMLGCKAKAEVLALHPAVLSPEFQPDGRRSMEKCLEMDSLAREKGYHHFEWVHRTAKGVDFPAEVSLTLVILDGKETLLVVWHDLTERMKATETLQLSEERFRHAFDDAAIGMTLTDMNTRWLKINTAFQQMLGYTEEELMQGNYAQLTHPDDLAPFQEWLSAVSTQGNRQPFHQEKRYFHKDGHLIWATLTVSVTCDEQNVPFNLIGQMQDITVRREAEQQLEAINAGLLTANEQMEMHICTINEQAVELEYQQNELVQMNLKLEALATTDGLTGLKNHRAFRDKLGEEWNRLERNHQPLSIILLDVDNFKTYNDSFGHPEGDKVLKTVAAIMEEAARKTDYVCRYGGEEFIIILPETNAEGAVLAAERFRKAIESQLWPLRPVTASFGVASSGAGVETPQHLVDYADKALYASKGSGRNRVTHIADLPPVNAAEVLPVSVLPPGFDLLRNIMEQETETLASATERIRESLAQAYGATIQSWSQLLDMRDRETEGHSARVTELTVTLAQHIGLNEEEILYARWGAMLHDVGKMGVPDSILHKPGPLTEEEWKVMRQHPTIAYEMLSPVSFLLPALDIPYCHHEKWDGSGYPRGLKGEEIPLSARLFAVIDVYDALRNDRPYRKAWSKRKTVAHLRSLSGTHFDPRAVKVFLALLSRKTSAEAEEPISLAA